MIERGPYLSADPTEQVPAGWTVLPAGTIDGSATTVAFDPAVHDVCRTDRPFTAAAAVGVTAAGWRRVAATDTGGEIWLRDRVASVLQQLARHRQTLGQTQARSL